MFSLARYRSRVAGHTTPNSVHMFKKLHFPENDTGKFDHHSGTTNNYHVKMAYDVPNLDQPNQRRRRVLANQRQCCRKCWWDKKQHRPQRASVKTQLRERILLEIRDGNKYLQISSRPDEEDASNVKAETGRRHRSLSTSGHVTRQRCVGTNLNVGCM